LWGALDTPLLNIFTKEDLKKGDKFGGVVLDKEYKKGEQVGEDFVDLGALHSLSIGTLKELIERVEALESKG